MDESLIKQYAAGEFSKIFKKCIQRYAKNYNIHYTHVFMMLGLDETGENVTYKTLVNTHTLPENICYEPLKSIGIPSGYRPAVRERITILNVLNVPLFHIRGYNLIAPPYIQAALLRMAEAQGLLPHQVSVFIYTDDTIENDVSLVLCRVDGDEIKQMVSELGDISELF